jgi:mannosyltransferase OCH1-like enzyme
MTASVPDWSKSAEDHAFRSTTIHWIVQREPLASSAIPSTAIPKVIIRFWHDAADLPADVEECLRSWDQLSDKGFDLRQFDDTSARQFIADSFDDEHVRAFDRCYHPAMRCDYFRLCYILRNGGMYVDADEEYCGAGCELLFQDGRLKLQPLCYDLATERMVPANDFFRDETPSPTRIYYVNNNPIAAPPGHALLDLALGRATSLILGKAEHPEIQSTTGPGNLSASLVRHVKELWMTGADWDFTVLRNWDGISTCRWFLSYRNDARNWRLANGRD